MDTLLSIRIREIFGQAVDQADDKRPAFVNEACGNDGDLRAAVESLLKAHQRAKEFLADPAIDPSRFADAGQLIIGSKVGPYTLLRPLGEGGYGAVYLALQEVPIRRQVALKVIKSGMDSRQVIARFETERQALALMDHPNIARVFDAGTSAAGRPYFVMEYVDGVPITTFCQNLELSDRLKLFSRVCMAVQHAHQKGIIHRDLKPANILVTVQDGISSPKIIDFGIAKAVEGSIADHSVLTSNGQFLGTPQYMSPEQAGSAPDVDTRTDIYALGTILYELLTGVPAFDPGALRSAARGELERIIREVDPPWPSTRVRAAMEDSPGRSWSHTAARRTRASQLRGELDWIVMRSMEKDRERRYETAESLASDLLRFLAHEPVAAGPPSRRYRLAKFARRNRGLLLAGATVFISLIGGLTIATIALVKANHDRQRAFLARMSESTARTQAEEQRAVAVTNEANARAQAQRLLIVQTLLYRLLSSDRNTHEAPPPGVLDYAAKKMEESSLEGHPEVQGPVHAALGNGYYHWNLLPQAEAQYRKAMEALRRTNPGDDPNFASAISNTALALVKQEKFDEAEPLLREALAMYRRLDHGDNITDAPVLLNLGRVLSHQENYAEAEKLIESALTFFREYYGRRGIPVAGVLELLGDVLERAGKPDEASARRAEAADIRASAKPADGH